MVTVRSAKSKGSQYEMSVRDSLLPIYPQIRLTKEEGFRDQYDLVDHEKKICIECKKHKGFSWNELEKLYWKLHENAPLGYKRFLIFQGNRQPCLVMSWGPDCLRIMKFEDVFETRYIVHGKKKKVIDDDLG